jgi:hypothetical protein
MQPIKREIEEMVSDFEDADEAQAHAQAQQSGGRGDEGEGGHALVAADLGVVGIPDEHLQHQQVLLGVVEQELSQLLEKKVSSLIKIIITFIHFVFSNHYDRNIMKIQNKSMIKILKYTL